MGGLLREYGQRGHARMQVGHHHTQVAQAGETQEREACIGCGLRQPRVRVGPAQRDQLRAPRRDREDGMRLPVFHQAADNGQAVPGEGMMQSREAQSLDVSVSLPRILLIRVPVR
jgi:hypothetical protein